MNLRLSWHTPDPEGTALRLSSAIGGRADRAAPDIPDAPPRLVVPLVGGEVGIVEDLAGPDRLTLDGVSLEPDDERAALRGEPRLLGLGLGTVDAERAVPEVAGVLGLAADTFRPAEPDEWLGATALAAHLGPLVVAVLQPSTEGRLAAALARSGEGPCALYVTSLASGPTRVTPFGTACLVMADRPWGPFVLTLRRSPRRPR